MSGSLSRICDIRVCTRSAWSPFNCARSDSYAIKTLCEKLCSATGGHVAVSGVVSEELGLGLEGIHKRLVALDVLLRSVDNTNETQLERVHATRQNLERVRAVVHKIELGENTDSALSLGVHLTGNLERLGVDQVDIGGGDG